MQQGGILVIWVQHLSVSFLTFKVIFHAHLGEKLHNKLWESLGEKKGKQLVWLEFQLQVVYVWLFVMERGGIKMAESSKEQAWLSISVGDAEISSV